MMMESAAARAGGRTDLVDDDGRNRSRPTEY